MMRSERLLVCLSGLCVAAAVACSKDPMPGMSQPWATTSGAGTPTASQSTAGVAAPPSAAAAGTGAATGASGVAAPTSVGAAGSVSASAAGSGAAGAASAAPAAGGGASGVGATMSVTSGATGSAGTGSSGADGGATATAGSSAAAGGGAVAAIMPPCLKKASQVIIMGDTFVIWAEGFLDALKKDTGMAFRNYALEGAGLGSVNMILGPNLVPPEFDQALSADPNIIAVIMTGGGTDLLLPDPMFGSDADKCKTNAGPTLDVCKQIMDLAFKTGVTLFQKMADNGVKDIVYYFYPEVPKGTLIGGENPNAMLQYALPLAKAFCDDTEKNTAGKTRCHFLDLGPIFAGHADWFVSGDVHPNMKGSMAMSKAIVQLMKDKCIAQPESSGCCMP